MPPISRADRRAGYLKLMPLIQKTSDFSLHQFPSTNMLKELKDQTDVDVRVLVVQIEHIPSEIRLGISASVMAAVPGTCRRVMDILRQDPA